MSVTQAGHHRLMVLIQNVILVVSPGRSEERIWVIMSPEVSCRAGCLKFYDFTMICIWNPWSLQPAMQTVEISKACGACQVCTPTGQKSTHACHTFSCHDHKKWTNIHGYVWILTINIVAFLILWHSLHVLSSSLKERAFNWNYHDVKASKTKTMKLAAKLIEPFVPRLS